jgi:hypothetical protein
MKMLNFWLVDFNNNEMLMENIPEGWPLILYRDEIEYNIFLSSINVISSPELKNRIIINTHNDDTKWLTTGDIKKGSGLWWVNGYKLIKDFNITGHYEKVYLKDHVVSHTQYVPIDNIKKEM